MNWLDSIVARLGACDACRGEKEKLLSEVARLTVLLQRVVKPVQLCACGCGRPLQSRYNTFLLGHRRNRTSAAERCWRNTDKSTKDGMCWIWRGRKSNGYGVFWVGDGTRTGAHRFSLILAGFEVPDDAIVCHRCDTPLCVRPDHLFVGSQRDNIRDAVAKGRWRIGERNNHAKLTDEQIIEIRNRYAKGASSNCLAEEFALNRSHVSEIVSGKVWKLALGPITKRPSGRRRRWRDFGQIEES